MAGYVSSPGSYFNSGCEEITLRLKDPTHRGWRYLPSVLATLEGHDLSDAQVGACAYWAGPHEVNNALKTAWKQLRGVWSSPHRPDYFINGLLRGIVDYLRDRNKQEPIPMSTDKTFNPYVVSVLIAGQTTPLVTTFDPDYFVVKKGDVVVIDISPTGDTSVNSLRVGTVANDPTGAEINSSVAYRVVERVDVEQYDSRKEKAKAKDRARAILHEAAKRTTEADLYDRVKSKLTPEEQQLIKDSLGYGTATEGSAD